MPPAEVGPLALVALAPLLWLLSGCRPRRGMLLGFAFGFAYFGATLYWILLFGELAWAALTIMCAGFAAAFGLLAPVLRREGNPWRSAFAYVALWVSLEWLRSVWPLGGFTWGQLGSTQAGNRLLLPLASVAGVWGMSFVVALANALLVVAVQRGRGGAAGALPPVALAAVLVAAPVLIPLAEAEGRPVRVAALQVDVLPARGPDRLTEDRVVAEMYVDLHRGLAADPPDLAIWGESALDPGAFEPETWEAVTGAIAEVGVPTVAGAVPRGKDGRLRNATLVFDGRGRVIDRYTKVHLVPYGEYIPLQWLVGWVSALDQIPYVLERGERVHTLEAGGLRFGSVICFENSFPTIDRELVKQGAGFLVVTTNNASYGTTAASRQHLMFSRLRAVENGRWVVHAALSGISAIIDPSGRVVARAELFEEAILRSEIRLATGQTLYTRLGDWAAWGSVLLLLLLFAAAPKTRRSSLARGDPLPEEPRTLVILPTYNERPTIERVIRGVRALPEGVDVLVVDDGSPDGTAAAVGALMDDDAGVRLLERPAKAGLASAYLAGFRTGLEEGYELVVEMDSDLSHDPEELSRLLSAAREADLVVGSRYVPGGAVTNWSGTRLALSRGGNLYARLALGLPVHDATSGFRVYRRTLLEHLTRGPIRSDGYGFQVELALRSWLGGFRVSEVPITFREREHGVSKISRRIVFEALWLITVWGLKLRLGRLRWAGTEPP